MAEVTQTIAGAGWVTTAVDLARGLELSDRMVRKLLADPRWPFGEHGPWNVHLCRKWHRTELARSDPQIKRLYEVARLKKLTAEIERIRGQVVQRTFHVECLERLAGIFVHALELLEQALPTLLAMKDETEVSDILAERFDHIRTQIATGRKLELERDESARGRGRAGRPLSNRSR